MPIYLMDKAYRVGAEAGVAAHLVVVQGSATGECNLPGAANAGAILGVTMHSQSQQGRSVAVRKAGIAECVAFDRHHRGLAAEHLRRKRPGEARQRDRRDEGQLRGLRRNGRRGRWRHRGGLPVHPRAHRLTGAVRAGAAGTDGACAGGCTAPVPPDPPNTTPTPDQRERTTTCQK